jgi:hypothetical protein
MLPMIRWESRRANHRRRSAVDSGSDSSSTALRSSRETGNRPVVETSFPPGRGNMAAGELRGTNCRNSPAAATEDGSKLDLPRIVTAGVRRLLNLWSI